MKEDKILIAQIIGVASTIGAEILSQIFTLLGITEHSLYNLSSLIITLNRPSFIIGFFVSSATGGFLAVLLYLAFMKLGSQHITIKCIGVSIIMWIALELIFLFAIESKLIDQRPLSAYYGHLTGAIFFGILLGILLKRFLFSKNA